MSKCELCGEPMPPGEEMFKYHGYSCDCPKPPLPREKLKAAVVIDPWKLDIFRRHLAKAGYEFKEGPGLTKDMLNFYVEIDDLKALEVVVRAANAECAKEQRDD